MADPVTFRKLELRHVEPNPEQSSLEDWYCQIRDTPITDFDDGDLSRACRQGLCLEHVVPIAVARLEVKPLAGAMYVGELLAAMNSVPRGYWKDDQRSSERLLNIVDRAKQLSRGRAIIKDADELAERIGRGDKSASD